MIIYNNYSKSHQPYLPKSYMQQQSDIDSQTQIDNQISKIDHLMIYLKQMTLHVSAIIKDPNLRDYLKSYIQNFDRTIDQYNYEYLRRRIKKLQYFVIEPISIMKQEPFFVDKISLKDKVNQEYQQLYFINLVFSKECKTQIVTQSGKRNKNVKNIENVTYGSHYRMHVQIYKEDNLISITNPILSKFQKNCTNQIIQNLIQRGYVNHFDGSAVVLNCKKPVYKSVNIKSTGGDLMQFLRIITQKFLRNMVNTLLKQKICSYCNKHYMFDAQMSVMMPPTLTICLMKQTKQKIRQDNTSTSSKQKQERTKILHQVCSLKYLKSPPFPQQNRMQPRQQHQGQQLNQQ